MSKEIISTKEAPAAVGPYSQAVKVGNLIYTAGQIPLDPATGKLVQGDIAAQTDRVMQNLHAVLTAAGSSLDNVVKTTIFLTDMGHYRAVNEVYGRYMAANPPARSAVQVAALPLGALIEIEMVAAAGD
ncbi:MAG TPA: RidA family protein [Anaerolineae bacterium]|nr:RidA family protein [Anaerolineae bacterium]HIP71496.1 RidA family protein [Anaerolineae bacterium]